MRGSMISTPWIPAFAGMTRSECIAVTSSCGRSLHMTWARFLRGNLWVESWGNQQPRADR